MLDERLLKREERAVFELRSLYRKHGYLPYKMSKFEEYDFYARNKDFLVSDSVITFTDTNGKLMALKPDVTLSIIKNFKDEPGCLQRVSYNENVYRVSGDTHEYKEILQTGIECMGSIDLYTTLDVLRLAEQSLKTLSDRYVLEISHLGILGGLLDLAGADSAFRAAATACIGNKNAHELEDLCKEYGVSEDVTDKLTRFLRIYGKRSTVLEELETLCEGDGMTAALNELKQISAALDRWDGEENIKFDFSLVNDMKYYNGIVFQGYVEGIPEVMLSGGQYDLLMQRIGRKSGAIGFAVYLDLLENFQPSETKYDVDTVLLYDDGADAEELADTVESLIAKGKQVSVQKKIPAHLSFRELRKFTGKGVGPVEDND
ncbi:MAG: ATP phosphoribosyltransferase regulatory subunit [Clostridia bacterium]|nr:ATP phosphoribosyltransferase regulatory subunit [Clostridia bacterium]